MYIPTYSLSSQASTTSFSSISDLKPQSTLAEAEAELTRVEKMNRAYFLMVSVVENRRLALKLHPNSKVGLVKRSINKTGERSPSNFEPSLALSSYHDFDALQHKCEYVPESDIDSTASSEIADFTLPEEYSVAVSPIHNQIEVTNPISTPIADIQKLESESHRSIDSGSTQVGNELESTRCLPRYENRHQLSNDLKLNDDDQDAEVVSIMSKPSWTSLYYENRKPKKSDIGRSTYIQDVQSLNRVRLCRQTLTKWVHYPFFDEMVIGCYIRIGIGACYTGTLYKICEILEVVEQECSYQLGDTFTNKVLKARFGDETHMYRMEFVSTKEFTWMEFAVWKVRCEEAGILPLHSSIEEKAEELNLTSQRSLSDEEEEYMLEQKRRFHPIATKPFLYYERKS